MKTIKLILAASIFFGLSMQAAAFKEEFKKTISKSFDVNKNAQLVLKNKFGKIQCENWDKNTIGVEVEITVDAASQEKANKYFDKINISVSGSSSEVSVISNFDDDLFKNNKDEISVDFKISMPATVGLDVDHKFGDLILPAVGGNSKVKLGYGTINAKKFSGEENNLDIKFSEGYIGYVKTAQLELQYGELEIDEAGNLSAETKFSSFKLGRADVLILETGYDDDVIGSVRDLDIKAGFSDVEIRNVSERLVADIDYGEIKVKEIASGFSLVDVTNSFSDANLGFHPEASFRLSATVKMGDLTYPRDKARLDVAELSFTSNKYEGVIGKDTNTGSKVLVECKNGGINLFYR